MPDRRIFGVFVMVFAACGAACATGGDQPSRLVSATSKPTLAFPTLNPSLATPSATPTPIVAVSPSNVAPTPSVTASAGEVWRGIMDSVSDYKVTAQDGGLVCSALWTTALTVNVAGDATVTGTATTTLNQPPDCTHPEFNPTPMSTMESSISGAASATEFTLLLHQVSYGPPGSIDAAGMSASIYGIGDPTPPTITIPITSPGHAEGPQELQTISGVNAYTSENTITLDCPTC